MGYSKRSSKRKVYSTRGLPQETSVRVCSVTQLCLILCKPMDCSSLSSSVCGILQARILEWVAISYSKGSSQPRDPTCISCISWIGRRTFFFLPISYWEAHKERRKISNNLIYHLKDLIKEKKKKPKPRVRRKKEIVNIREEINKIETKKQQKRSMKSIVDFLKR